MLLVVYQYLLFIVSNASNTWYMFKIGKWVWEMLENCILEFIEDLKDIYSFL